MTIENSLNPKRKLFFGLFIFPLVIAVGMAVLLCGVVLLTTENDTPQTLISAIKSGSPSRRWQKAFELSNELNRPDIAKKIDPAILNEIIFILKDKQNFDPKTRNYMAIALGRFNIPVVVQTLKEALSDPAEDVRLSALWSLGTLQARECADEVKKFLEADRSEFRKIAAYVLGAMGDASAIPSIQKLLNDPSHDVRWNAALALARLGNDGGQDILLQMVDPALFSGLGMKESEIEIVRINAIKGLALIQKPESIKILQSLSRQDNNLKIRQAAMDALSKINKK